MQGFSRVPRQLLVVHLKRMGFCNPPQVSSPVEVINNRRLPGVLINVEVTAGFYPVSTDGYKTAVSFRS